MLSHSLLALALALSLFSLDVSAQRGFFGGGGRGRNGAGAAGGAKCATGVHMIVARASTEPPGEGIIGAVADDVKQQVPGSDSVAVDYPATLSNYANSEAQGVSAMQDLLEEYAAACPGSKVVLMGYSQGAQVVGDVISGGATGTGGGFGKRIKRAVHYRQRRQIPAQANVVAIIQMGDPTFTLGQDFNVGNARKGGIFARQDTSALEAVGDKIQSYCDSPDTFCDSGNSLATHLGYVNERGTDATDFIVQKANAA
ncbi:hypothetical protein JCM6882_009319 [Rhodosporidiobolus microsporus]